MFAMGASTDGLVVAHGHCYKFMLLFCYAIPATDGLVVETAWSNLLMKCVICVCDQI